MRNSGGRGQEEGTLSVHRVITTGKREAGRVVVVVSPLRQAQGRLFDRFRAGPSTGSGQAFGGRRKARRRVRGERRRRQLGRIEAGWPGYPYGRPGRGGGGQVSSVCRRCVQFPRQCVPFSGKCVPFSGKCVQSASECVQSGLTTRSLRRPRRRGSWAVSRWRLDGVSARRRLTMALASGDGAGARGVHRVGGDVFSFCPNVFTLRANVFSFRLFPPPMCSLFRPMCSVGVDDALARAAPARRFRGGIGAEIKRHQRAGDEAARVPLEGADLLCEPNLLTEVWRDCLALTLPPMQGLRLGK